MTVLDNP